MNLIMKIAAVSAVVAGVGLAAGYGIQRASNSLASEYETAYQKAFANRPVLIKPADAENWVAGTRRELTDLDSHAVARELKLMVASFGARNDLRELDQLFKKMIEQRRDQLAAVEKRIADGRSGGSEPWMAQMPAELQSQAREAVRMIAWLKSDVGRAAEFKLIAEAFEAKSAQVRQQLTKGAGAAIQLSPATPTPAPAPAPGPAPAGKPDDGQRAEGTNEERSGRALPGATAAGYSGDIPSRAQVTVR